MSESTTLSAIQKSLESLISEFRNLKDAMTARVAVLEEQHKQTSHDVRTLQEQKATRDHLDRIESEVRQVLDRMITKEEFYHLEERVDNQDAILASHTKAIQESSERSAERRGSANTLKFVLSAGGAVIGAILTLLAKMLFGA